MIRHRRIRAVVRGAMDRPRLTVFRSAKHMVAQLINDDTGTTLAFVTDASFAKEKGTKTERARMLGINIAKLAKEKGISMVVFDRGGYAYQGRVKALADAAREAGLVF